jgi:hypothetical protein
MLRVTFLLAGNNERHGAVAFICFMARRLSHLASTIKSKQEINYLLHAECRRAAVAHDRHPAKTFYDRRNLSCWQFLLLLSARLGERCSPCQLSTHQISRSAFANTLLHSPSVAEWKEKVR